MQKNILYISAVLLLVISGYGSYVYAADLGNIKMDIRGDFVVYPAKNELFMDPGEEKTRSIHIINRTEQALTFNIQKQDMVAGDSATEAVKFADEGEDSPYTISGYLELEEEDFVLESQEQRELRYAVSLPDNPNLAGLYGALLVSTSIEGEHDEDFIAGESRAASLLFVRVNGDIQEEGRLLDFYSDKKTYGDESIAFGLLTENTGNVHLNSYGEINIYNILGRKVDRVILGPWFTMPEGQREREVVWSGDFMFGRYTAEARINRGYGDDGGIIDEKQITFWVLPWKSVAVAVAGTVLFLLLVAVWRRKKT